MRGAPGRHRVFFSMLHSRSKMFFMARRYKIKLFFDVLVITFLTYWSQWFQNIWKRFLSLILLQFSHFRARNGRETGGLPPCLFCSRILAAFCALIASCCCRFLTATVPFSFQLHSGILLCLVVVCSSSAAFCALIAGSLCLFLAATVFFCVPSHWLHPSRFVPGYPRVDEH